MNQQAEVYQITPDTPPPEARSTGDPMKDLQAAMSAKRTHYTNKLSSVRQELTIQRKEAQDALTDYESTRGRQTLMAYCGEIPKDELAVSAKIAEANRAVIDDIDLAMPLITAGGDDPAIKEVTAKMTHLVKTVAVIRILSKRCLALSVEEENMAATMHMKQLHNQRKSTLIAIDTLMALSEAAYGPDEELVKVAEALKEELDGL